MNARRGALAVLALALLVAGGALTVDRAGAAPVPLYNAPPGGGAVQEQVFKIGPIHLDAMGGAHWEDEQNVMIPRPAGDFGAKYFLFDLVDGNGSSVDRMTVHLHHFVMAQVFAKDPMCPTRKVSGAFVNPFAGAGAERTPIVFPDPYVLPVKANDGWGATWHLMNMSGSPQDVWIQYKVGVQPGANATNSRLLTSYFMDVVGCSMDPVFDVPGDGGPGSTYSKSKQMVIPAAGIMVGTGGHLHDGGINTVLTHQDGSVICDSPAHYDEMGMITSITGCPVHDTVAKGETLTLTANYDNSKPYYQVMGINISYVWNGDQGPMPTTTTTTSTSTTTTTAPGGDGGDASGQQGAGSTTTTTAAPAGGSTVVTTSAVVATPVSGTPALAG